MSIFTKKVLLLQNLQELYQKLLTHVTPLHAAPMHSVNKGTEPQHANVSKKCTVIRMLHADLSVLSTPIARLTKHARETSVLTHAQDSVGSMHVVIFEIIYQYVFV